jgi:hypothetical protein
MARTGSVLDFIKKKIDPGGFTQEISRMARQPRFEYPGAVYHVMARERGQS